ncbi:MAG: NAD(P)-dependent oxidoreductase [bacterium]|nr:NAD(P)-dependent oxidoreductase [bacterium]
MTGRAGLIGCGRMGVPIAHRLIETGHELLVCQRGRSAEIVAAGGRIAGDGSAQAVASEAEIVLTCLPSAGALHEVGEGVAGIAHVARPGLVVLELSTLAVRDKEREREALAGKGAVMLDCPISGTPAMVPRGRTSIYASGEHAMVEQVRTVLEAFGGRVDYVGPFGAGSRVKFLANMLVAVHTCAAAETIALARRAGLDASMVVEALTGSPAASSGMLAARGAMMASERFPEPALGTVEMLRKDLSQASAMVSEVSSAAPLLEVASEALDVAASEGAGEADIACLVNFVTRSKPGRGGTG